MNVTVKVSNNAIITAQPSRFLLGCIELSICDHRKHADLTIWVDQTKGRELVDKLTKQLDEMPETAKSIEESRKEMLERNNETI